jgi:hypothetical protein
MATWQPEVPVPGLDHARSHYFELDVVGSDPVYITGSVYEYEGGPLLKRTPTFVDTNANDPWERPGIHDAVFTEGPSGIFSSWADVHPVFGYHGSYDGVYSASDGPAAVNPSPADGATDVPVDATLSWIEAEFATSRELWIGRAGAMQKVDPAPTSTTYTAALEIGQTYEWRVDQVGPSGTVTGRTWTFMTPDCISVDDFESYASDEDIRSVWIDNIDVAGVEYVSLETGENQSMLFECQNQYEPYFTEIARTFDSPQDWTAQAVEELSLSFEGTYENVEHLMYLTLEDALGQSSTVPHPYTHACQSDSWRRWAVALSLFSNGGVDLTSVKKITIGLGDGTNSGQADGDEDHIEIDQIELCPAGIHDTE